MNNALCSVCLDEAIPCNDKTDCGHFFHKTCLDAWLRENYTCPFCRKNLTPSASERNDEETAHSRFMRYLDNMTVGGAAALDSSFDSEYDPDDYNDRQAFEEEMRYLYDQDLEERRMWQEEELYLENNPFEDDDDNDENYLDTYNSVTNFYDTYDNLVLLALLS